MSFRFQKVVIGGTFDLLHLGHKKLLQTAFTEGKFVSIGLTTDTFNIARDKYTFQNFPQRKRQLSSYLNTAGFTNRYKIIPINDIYGNSHTDQQLEAIVVTSETDKNSKLINQKRLATNLPQLTIITTPHQLDQSAQIISSTRIRQGLIDQTGIVYQQFLKKIANKQIPQNLQQKLKKPLGNLIQEIPKKISGKLITIGDITTKNFLNKNQTPDLAVIDLKTKRIQHFDSVADLGISQETKIIKLNNPAGQISSELIDCLLNQNTSKNQTVIQILGEEDLVVLPAVLLSPLGTRIYYGQPDQGLVSIIVNPSSKKKIYQLLSLE